MEEIDKNDYITHGGSTARVENYQEKKKGKDIEYCF